MKGVQVAGASMSGRRMRRALGVLFAAIVAAGLLAPGRAHGVACFGAPITTDTTLTADITNCPDNGIEIAASGITLNLDGHTIDGDNNASGVGIFMEGVTGVTILGPGTVRDFGTGIRGNNTSKVVVDNVTVTENDGLATGIVFTRLDTGKKAVTKGNVVRNSTITNNDGTGVLFYKSSKGSQITNNTITGNNGDGIFLGGAGDDTDIDGNSLSDEDTLLLSVSGAQVSGNIVTGNGGTGIGIDAELGKGNVINGNTSSENGTTITTPTSGHDSRGDDDNGGHGIKVAGRLKATQITNNIANGNGTPDVAVLGTDKNGAGILIAGQQKTISITDNELIGNAFAGVFIAGVHRRTGINGNAVNDNLQNGERDEGAIMLSGVVLRTTIGNNTLDGNNSSGIAVEGHNRKTVIASNQITDSAGGGACTLPDRPGCVPTDPPRPREHDIDNDTAGISIMGRTLKAVVSGNTVTGTTNTEALRSGHGIILRGALVGGKFLNNQANNNEGHGIGVFAQFTRIASKKDPPPDSFGGDDILLNSTRNLRLTGNITNDNDNDGISLVADATVKDNAANNNDDIGIHHEPDPVTGRAGDPEDGPHLIADAGGNTATGNGVLQCSPTISC